MIVDEINALMIKAQHDLKEMKAIQAMFPTWKTRIAVHVDIIENEKKDDELYRNDPDEPYWNR